MWAKPWLLQRDTKSAYNMILQECRLGDRDSFRNFLRMNTETFDELARVAYPALSKSQTRFRKPLSVLVLKDKYLRCPPFLRPFFPRSFFERFFVCSCPNNLCRLNRTTPAHLTMPIKSIFCSLVNSTAGFFDFATTFNLTESSPGFLFLFVISFSAII